MERAVAPADRGKVTVLPAEVWPNIREIGRRPRSACCVARPMTALVALSLARKPSVPEFRSVRPSCPNIRPRCVCGTYEPALDRYDFGCRAAVRAPAPPADRRGQLHRKCPTAGSRPRSILGAEAVRLLAGGRIGYGPARVQSASPLAGHGRAERAAAPCRRYASLAAVATAAPLVAAHAAGSSSWIRHVGCGVRC